MKTLYQYVEKEFFGLAESNFDDDMLIDFIAKSAQLDSDVYDEIKDIDADDLIVFISEFDDTLIRYEIRTIQKLMVINAKEQVLSILSDIVDSNEAAECDAAEEARQERRISTHQGY